MGIFILISGGLTCAFFLYVLVQFHRELIRTEGKQRRKSDEAFQTDSRLSSTRHAELTEKKIQKILTISRKGGEGVRGKNAARKIANSGGILYAETVFPIGFVVTPTTKAGEPGHKGDPSKRIA